MDSKQRNVLALIVITVLVVGAWLLFWPPNEKITQGLDIQGGVSVILTAEETTETAVTDDVMERAELIIRNRVDSLGASEASIQRQGSDSILVQLPGISNAEEALAALGQTGQLEIRDVTGYDDDGEPILGDILLTGDVVTSAAVDVGSPDRGDQRQRHLQRRRFAEVGRDNRCACRPAHRDRPRRRGRVRSRGSRAHHRWRDGDQW